MNSLRPSHHVGASMLSSALATLIILLAPRACLTAQGAPSGPAAQVMIVGSLHLQQIEFDSIPVSVDLIRRSISRFAPDMVVVEWLHPSIDAATTFNYRSLGDLETLGRLWGYRPATWTASLDSATATTRRLREQKAPSAILAAARTELGKLYYLNRDQANAAYQWWMAQRLGADTRDLRRLSRNHLEGSEAAEFGFWTAAQHGLERVTPFDYQGPEAGSAVWGEMLDSLTTLAVARVDHAKPGDARWKASVDTFTAQRQRLESRIDTTWLARYGALPEVRQYVEAFFGWGGALAPMPTTRDGLAQMRWLQSDEYAAREREGQLVMLPKLAFGHFGERRLQGLRRRNEIMADYLEADARRSNARKILVIVGSGHKFFLEDILRARGYEIVPSSRYMP